MYKTIIFDIGGVIIDFSEGMYISYLSKKLGLSSRYLSAIVLPLVVEMEYGRMTLRVAEKEFSKGIMVPESRLYFVEAVRKLAKVNRNVVRFMRRLGSRYNLGIISNISHARYTEFGKLAIDSLVGSGAVKKVVASCLVGMRKPDARIYRLAIKELDAEPNETVFIDNQHENVIGAERVGIRGITFTGYHKLVSDLEKLGIGY